MKTECLLLFLMLTINILSHLSTIVRAIQKLLLCERKSDVLEVFKNYNSRIEKQTGNKIKKFRSDNGREYFSNDFKSFH